MSEPHETTSRWFARFAALCSALVPGLGQVLIGRWADAALMLLAATWIHGFFAGLAEVADRVDAVLWLAFGLPSGFARPTGLVFTVLGLALHAFAAWDIVRRPRSQADLEHTAH